jgi:hypothetical protein
MTDLDRREPLRAGAGATLGRTTRRRRSRSGDRWEIGTTSRLGRRPEHGLVLREG